MTQIDNGAGALEDFAVREAKSGAQATAQAFEAAGRRIEAALVKAAKTGELSFHDMAEAILKDLARIAVQQVITGPLETALGGLGSERNSGIPQSPQGPMNITLNLSGVSDAGSFTRSQGQISAALARAVSEGQRFL
ncbi:phage tail tape measure C-terminal domain-containing protein [Robiginitomaculum antarcticum]|uniref:phage tail tape measure C-terminal domain-containing protein n=1 Tax=Robiginitomaculum antarcticum TaxID=437507 RepID=UPI00036A20F7|nr:phage tail tape measure C-terminal domain-containing protein [Robiginitomaculum antarcticum]